MPQINPYSAIEVTGTTPIAKSNFKADSVIFGYVQINYVALWPIILISSMGGTIIVNGHFAVSTAGSCISIAADSTSFRLGEVYVNGTNRVSEASLVLYKNV